MCTLIRPVHNSNSLLVFSAQINLAKVPAARHDPRIPLCITLPAALMGLPAWVRGLYRPVMRLDSILLTSLLNRLKVTHVQFFIAGGLQVYN